MASVRNHDLKTFDDILKRVSDEIASSNSALGNELEPGDGERLVEYTQTVDKVMDHMQASPILDLPYTSPETVWDLKEIEEYEEVVNEHLDHILREIRLIRLAVPISQSAMKSNRFHKKDFSRWKAQWQKIKSYITDVIAVLLDQDFPDTAGSGASANA